MTHSTSVERRRRFARRALLSITTILCSGLAMTAHAEDARWTFPQQLTMSPHGVNLQTGRFIHSVTDLSIGDLKFVRSWGEVPSFTIGHSLGMLNTYSETPIVGWIPTNIGWTHNFNEGVYYWPGNNNSLPRVSVVVNSTLYLFAILSDGSIVPCDQASQGTSLGGSGTQWSFTDKGGNIYNFFAHPAIQQGGIPGNPTQLLQSVIYANGKRVDYSYTSSGQPSFIRSSTGYAIGLDYDGSGNVTAACGFNLASGYADASTGCGSASLKVSYAYDGAGQTLVSATDPLGHVVTYGYTTTHLGFALPTCLSLPNSPSCELQNVYGQQPGDALEVFDDQVRVQTTATGAVWRYNYRSQPDPEDQPVVAGIPRYSASQMTDPLGGGYGFRYDRGHLITLGTPAGITQYRYRYYSTQVGQGSLDPRTLDYFDIRPALIVPPENNREFIAHDNRGNLTQHSFWPKNSANPVTPSDPNQQNCCVLIGNPQMPAGSSTYTQTFLADTGYSDENGNGFVVGCGSGPADAKRCDKPLSRKDANGNETDYTYDPAHGGVLTETGPADANGVRPQTRYSYVQRQAWVVAPGGGYTTAGAPIWLLGSTSSCRTGAAASSGTGCAAGAGDEVVTTYDYGPDSGPNNLLPRGTVLTADGQSRRTCFAYDPQGNRISETQPRAGLTSCP